MKKSRGPPFRVQFFLFRVVRVKGADTDPARNMARFYTMALQPTLFGEWALLREWGRIGSAPAGSPPSRRPLWPWPNISKPSSAKAMRPFEFCVLGLSELACFSAQTLMRPLGRRNLWRPQKHDQSEGQA